MFEKLKWLGRYPASTNDWRIPDCDTCARDGHGQNYEQCNEDVKVWKSFHTFCWRPVGVLLVWNTKEI